MPPIARCKSSRANYRIASQLEENQSTSMCKRRERRLGRDGPRREPAAHGPGAQHDLPLPRRRDLAERHDVRRRQDVHDRRRGPARPTSPATGVTGDGVTLGATITLATAPPPTASSGARRPPTAPRCRTSTSCWAPTDTGHAVIKALTGLAPNTAYHFRVVATSDAGVRPALTRLRHARASRRTRRPPRPRIPT